MKTPNLVIGIVLLVLGLLCFAVAGAAAFVTCANTPLAASLLNLPECNSLVATVFFLGIIGLIFLIVSGVVLLVGRTKTPISQYGYSPYYQTPATNVPQAAAPARYCSSCGNLLMASTAYCPKCGAKV